MIKMHVSELAPGLVVAEDIKSKSNQVIVAKGSALTRQNISRLKFYNIDTVNIEDASVKRDLVVPERVDPIPLKEEVKPQDPIIPQAPPLTVTPKENAPTASVPVAPETTATKIATAAPKTTPEVQATVTTATTASATPKSAPNVPHVIFSPSFKQYQLDYTTSLTSMKESFNDIVSGKRIDEKKLLDQTAKAFDKNNSSLHLFDMLHNMRNSSDAVFAHSINVALISSTLGKWLKFSDEDLCVLALCGMLHDIGKTMIPEEILNKPGKYTPEEFAQMKRHPLLGFQRLKNEEIDPRIKKVALMHHERADGSGYPHGLKGDEIHPFAYIVTIADVYDAMTSSRSYRSPICPFEVIANFEEEGLHKYNTKFMLTFLSNIANTYQNNRVILNDGRSGTIVMLNQKKLSKPIIQLDSNQFLDLSKEVGLYIRAVI